MANAHLSLPKTVLNMEQCGAVRDNLLSWQVPANPKVTAAVLGDNAAVIGWINGTSAGGDKTSETPAARQGP